MPSDFLTPFPELDEEFCQSLRVLEATESLLQRVSLLEEGPGWGPVGRLLPRPALQQLPLLDRSVSMIEGKMAAVLPLLPPPGLAPGPSSSSSSSRYKTELCRSFAESGACKYGAKCQFAHGPGELRGLSRHPRYKTERCRTFHTAGFCPYGARCHFLHNDEEEGGGALLAAPPRRPLRHSLSFAGFSSSSSSSYSSSISSLAFARASSVSPPPPSPSPELLSPPLFPRLRPSYPFCGDALRFYASSSCDSVKTSPPFSPGAHMVLPHPPKPPLSAPPGLWRCSSADSLSEEGYASSWSLSSGCSSSESPSAEGRRLPIFSQLSVTEQ